MTGAVVLVSGLPGVGKTTAARQLAARAARGAHLDTTGLTLDDTLDAIRTRWDDALI
jgi:adenylate kinase family enzyme